MKKVTTAILCMGFCLLLSGCSDIPPLSPTQEIFELAQKGVLLEQTVNPDFSLPSDIYSGQLLQYFKIANIYIALVLRSSMNIDLSLPTVDTETTFGGILIAKEGSTQWSKLTEIKDINTDISLKNNPYYLTLDAQRNLLITIVDINGGGSGEGIMKVFVLKGNGKWKLQSCYYFGQHLGRDGIDSIDKYLKYSINFSAQTPETMSSCENTVHIANLSSINS